VRFLEEPEELEIMDLGSTNGTRINEQVLPANAPVAVEVNDVITIAGYEVRLSLAPAKAPLTAMSRSSVFHLESSATVVADWESPLVPDDEEETILVPPPASPEVPAPARHSSTPPPGKGNVLDHIRRAVDRTRPAYSAYRDMWSEVHRQISTALAETPPRFREHVARALLSTFEHIGQEKEFAKIIEENQLDLPTMFDAATWLQRLKQGDTTAPQEQLNVPVAMERIGALMETFSESFASLHRGYEQFGRDMALEVHNERNQLVDADNMRAVLHVLLDWRRDSNRAVNELRRAFSDLAIHQVALVHGVVEGVRELLQQLSPQSLAHQDRDSTTAAAGRRWLGGGRTTPADLWRRYQVLHGNLLEEDRFAKGIFGRGFARAYFKVVGSHEGDAPSLEAERVPGLDTLPYDS
jgi:predicted component of type VI protein secretion system